MLVPDFPVKLVCGERKFQIITSQIFELVKTILLKKSGILGFLVYVVCLPIFRLHQCGSCCLSWYTTVSSER